MNITPILEWKNIFLDTSVIIDNLLNPDNFKKNEQVENRIKLTHKLFDFFNETYNPEEKRTFYISAVTVGELLKLPKEVEIITFLIEFFDCADVVFVDYTKEIANDIQVKWNTYLPEENINQFTSLLQKTLNEDNVFNARGWVSDDLKINASASYFSNKLDVILTSDKRTFIPISNKLKLPVLHVCDLPVDLYNELDYKNPIIINN